MIIVIIINAGCHSGSLVVSKPLTNRLRGERRAAKAIALGRMAPDRAPSLAAHPVSRPGRDVTEAAAQIGQLHDAAAVLRAHPDYAAPRDRTGAVLTLLRSGRFPLLES